MTTSAFLAEETLCHVTHPSPRPLPVEGRGRTAAGARHTRDGRPQSRRVGIQRPQHNVWAGPLKPGAALWVHGLGVFAGAAFFSRCGARSMWLALCQARSLSALLIHTGHEVVELHRS